MPLRCPRCQVELRQPEMVKHLWLEHRLFLANGRVRDPWGVIDDGIKEWLVKRDAALLTRCLEAGEQLDGEEGRARVQQWIWKYQLGEAAARNGSLTEAQEREASLCPRCYALVPSRPWLEPRPLNLSPGRLSTGGYSVEVSEAGLFPQLEVATPRGWLYRGPEPNYRFSSRGAHLLLVGPLVGAAFLFAVLLAPWNHQPALLISVLLWAALCTHVVLRVRARLLPTPLERAFDYAWTLLVPRLHAEVFSLEDSAWVVSLAWGSADHGRPEVRERSLARVIHETEQAVAARKAPVEHLAQLWRLAVADAARAGRDPVMQVVHLVERSLKQSLPLAFAEHLLAEWESEMWTDGNLTRLRLLVCDRAFEAGLEVADLIEVGEQASALGDVLGTDDPEQLARLRLLWTLRLGRPWNACGEAATAFELAGYADLGSRILEQHPDLLLYEVRVESRANPSQGQVMVCGRGILFQNELFPEAPQVVDVRSRRGEPELGYELRVDGQSFPFPFHPGALAQRLERWCHYYFADFVPQVAAVHQWRSFGTAGQLRLDEQVTCPECRKPFWMKAGSVGVPAKRDAR